jgi:hypothetical protein
MEPRTMRVYYSDDHEGYWPVGAASVIVAHDILEAAELLEAQLTEMGMNNPKDFSLEELDLNEIGVTVLADGNY